MEVIKINNHPIAANTYIAFDEKSKKGVIVDPSFYIDKAVSSALDEGIDIMAVLLTHGHFDHIAGVQSVRRALKIPVYIHKDDADMLFSPERNSAASYGLDITADPAEYTVSDGQELVIGGSVYKVMHTPGHTKGSVCYLCGDVMFSGDTLFHMSIGRTDLPGGDFADMEKSLDRIAALDVDYRVYPGHEQSTSLFWEIDNNPFLRR